MGKAVVYKGFSDKGNFELIEYEEGVIKMVKQLPEYKNKTALLILLEKDSLEGFRQDKDMFKNRGKKHAAKPLKALLFGYEKIPVIEAEYKSVNKVKSSVRGFMKHVYNSSESNIYIIGIPKDIFESLINQLEKDSTGEEERQILSGDKIESFQDMANPDVLLKLLPKTKIPADIEFIINKKYIGYSPQIKFVKQMILRAAQSDAPVLLLGETGTGKSLVANLLHQISMRKSGKFREINCSALSAMLLESELFGHIKGAFTGAERDKKGLWQTADKGTLFLDELGDLALDHQVKILTAIQKGIIRKIGSENDIKVDTRLIAATNRNLDLMMQEGTFREDLYYRLRDFTITLPPLRQHKEDIPDLAHYFWSEIVHPGTPAISSDVIEELMKFDWPGNGRELRSVLSGLYGIYKNEKIRPEYLRLVPQLRSGIKRGIKTGQTDRIQFHGVECLQHLKRTDEIMRAIKVALRPVIWHHDYRKDKVERALSKVENYINEMEMLLYHPILFHAQDVFHMVRDLNGTIRDDLCNAKSGKEVDHLWDRYINKQYDETHEKIFSEVRWLEKLARGGKNNA